MSPDNIIDFWFAEKTQPLWFNSTPEFDSLLSERFIDTCRDAAAGKFSHWEKSATGSLALIILLDQFPLNIFRGKPESFLTEIEAVRLARQSVELGFDRRLLPGQRAFLYMPLMHSEKMDDQDLSVKCYRDAGLANNLMFAQHHHDIVKRFGRFPHRNAILGRTSTVEELAWLASAAAFHG